MTEIIFGDLAFLIWLIPILASFIVLFFGKFIDKNAYGHAIALIAMGTSFVLTLIISGQVLIQLLFSGHQYEYGTPLLEKMYPLLNWVEIGNIKLEVGVLIDPLSAVVSLMVALLAFLVVVYSRSYMSHEGSPRYYAEILLFSAAMLGLVISPTLFNCFYFGRSWEFVAIY